MIKLYENKLKLNANDNKTAIRKKLKNDTRILQDFLNDINNNYELKKNII
jgi:hypothetical protein